MIDGQRDVTELSVYVRRASWKALSPGWSRKASWNWSTAPGSPATSPHARGERPGGLRGIKIRAMTEIRTLLRGRLAPMADLLVAEINGCSTALELRDKLRKLEDALTRVMGPDGVELARRIGSELTRLVPKD